MFVQRPILGWGFGQFEYAARYHGGGGPLQLVEGDESDQLASHNVFLRFLAELGLIGFFLQTLVLTGWIGTARNTLRSTVHDSPKRPLAILFLAALCAYVAEAMFHDVTFIPQDNALIFFLAGAMGVADMERSSICPEHRCITSSPPLTRPSATLSPRVRGERAG
jgi:O-antigen ligase